MNQKIENLLNVSLDATKEELERSESLSVGFNWRDNTWEIIVKYSGSLDEIRRKYNVYIRELLNNYAIFVTDRSTIELIALEPVIDYIEKPKSIYFQLERSKSAACASNVWAKPAGPNVSGEYLGGEYLSEEFLSGEYLSGRGVIVAVIDTGIDIYNDEFRNADGSTRILSMYDQTIQKEYSTEDINTFLREHSNTCNSNISNVSSDIILQPPGVDNIQHGTNVSVIACGRSGVAYEADIIVVKMGFSFNNQFPRTTSLMGAIDYVIRKAMEYRKPVAINISYGSNYGDHNGNTLLENYINDIASSYRCSICIGSGNEADKAIHFGNTIKSGQTDMVEISVSEYESSIDIQIWKYYWDDIKVTLVSPDGRELGIVTQGRINRFQAGDTDIICLYGEPSPYNLYQEIYINLQPLYDYITPGIWKIQLYGGNIRQGTYNIWLPSSASINSATGVLRPETYNTITIPSTAAGCISVGAYNSYTGSYATFSGRGSSRADMFTAGIKPDILAPGVDINIRKRSGHGIEYTKVTGTSYATPFVTGSAALLMQWGIVLGNDRFMYGEKLKAYIRNGARPLGIVSEYPNSVTGYGTLCVSDSLP